MSGTRSENQENQDTEDGGTGEGPQISEATIVPEKLADDVMKPPLWKRLLFRVIPKLEKSEACVDYSILSHR